MDVPPHEPSYQYQPADVPSNPPVTANVVDKLSQMVSGEAVTEPATSELSFTEITELTQTVELHTFSALTKYIVVVVGDTVTMESFPSYVPPQVPLYQLQTEPTPNDPPVSNKVVDDPEHIVDGVPDAIVAGVELVFNVILVLIQFVVLHNPSPLT